MMSVIESTGRRTKHAYTRRTLQRASETLLMTAIFAIAVTGWWNV